MTGVTSIHGLNYRIDSLMQHKDGFRALSGGDNELRPVTGFTSSRNVLLIAAEGRYLESTPYPAGLVYLNHTPITSVSRETKYSTPFGFGNQSIGQFTGSDVWQASNFVTVNNRFSYMYGNLSIQRNGDGGSIVGTALTGRQLRKLARYSE